MNKQSAKKIIPGPIWRFGSNTYWAWHNRGQHNLARTFSSRWKQSMKELEKYHDKHAGERCFIVGNGPSLRKTDLTRLRGEYTFGLNRIFLLFPELGFTTTYLVSVNDLVAQQSADEMKNLDLPKFLTWRVRNWFHDDPRTIFLDTDYSGVENFSGNATGRIFEGFTVTYVAMQLAFYMGFQQAILIGVDHNFTQQGPANQTTVSEGNDPNHFMPNYFAKGFKWQFADLEGSERAYRMALLAYTQAGRSIIDATVEGKLTVFPKVDYNKLDFTSSM